MSKRSAAILGICLLALYFVTWALFSYAPKIVAPEIEYLPSPQKGVLIKVIHHPSAGETGQMYIAVTSAVGQAVGKQLRLESVEQDSSDNWQTVGNEYSIETITDIDQLVPSNNPTSSIRP